MKERIKDLLLFVLFVSAIALAYLNMDFRFASLEKQAPDSLYAQDVKNIIMPRYFFYGEDQNIYTKIIKPDLKENIWADISPKIADYLLNAKSFEPIIKSEYIEKFSNDSLLLGFGLPLKNADLADLILSPKKDINRSSMTNPNTEISEILVNGRRIYIKDAEGNYFKVDSPNRILFSKTKKIIAGSSSRSYRRIFERFDISTVLGDSGEYKNYVLIPFQYDSMVTARHAQRELKIESEEGEKIIDQIAASIFGKSFDFVKRSVDSDGSIVMMYGLGEKSLIFTPRGDMVYRYRLGANEKSARAFTDNLRKAISFIEKSGGLPEGLHLRSYSESGAESIFNFTYEAAGYKVLETDSPLGIRVVLSRGIITEVIRNIMLPGEIMLTADEFYTIENYTENNLDLISQKIGLITGDERYRRAYVRSKIESIDMVFTKFEQTLMPTWEMVIGGHVFLFDAYTGENVEIPEPEGGYD